MISLSRGFSCRGLSSISITLHVSFIDSHHHLRLRRSCISFLLFIWHSMQTPTAFKTLKRLSAQLIRNRESLFLPGSAAAIRAHCCRKAWNIFKYCKDVKSMNRDIDDPYRQSGAMCLSRYKKMHPAAVAPLEKQFLPASEVYCSPTLFHAMWLMQVH